MKNIWKPYEAKFTELYPIMCMANLILIFPFKPSAIKSKASAMKLRKLGRLFTWNYADELRLCELYAETKNIDLAKMFNKTEGTIIGAAFKLGLKKTPEFMQRHSENTRFKKGQIPANKGKAMPKDVYAKCQATMFKKGNEPHNTMFDGHERITKDGYTEVRIKKGEYQLKHRVLWGQYHGAVPDDSIVIFKDGDKQNIVIENLHLISKKENMDRNTIHRYPVELKSVIRLVGKLKKQINGKEQN